MMKPMQMHNTEKSQTYQDQQHDVVGQPAGTEGWSSAAGGASLPPRGCAWSPSGLAPLAAPPEVAYFPPALPPKQGVTKRCRLSWLTNRRPRI